MLASTASVCVLLPDVASCFSSLESQHQNFPESILSKALEFKIESLKNICDEQSKICCPKNYNHKLQQCVFAIRLHCAHM